MTNLHPRLQTLIFEITQRCNHACLHCYNVWHPDASGRPLDYPCGELDTAQTLTLVNKALDETRCRHVTLTGGEPLLREDLGQILDLLRRQGVMATVISNGRARSVAPSTIARIRSCFVRSTPAASACSRAWSRKSSMITPVSAVRPASARKPAPTATLRS